MPLPQEAAYEEGKDCVQPGCKAVTVDKLLPAGWKLYSASQGKYSKRHGHDNSRHMTLSCSLYHLTTARGTSSLSLEMADNTAPHCP